MYFFFTSLVFWILFIYLGGRESESESESERVREKASERAYSSAGSQPRWLQWPHCGKARSQVPHAGGRRVITKTIVTGSQSCISRKTGSGAKPDDELRYSEMMNSGTPTWGVGVLAGIWPSGWTQPCFIHLKALHVHPKLLHVAEWSCWCYETCLFVTHNTLDSEVCFLWY